MTLFLCMLLYGFSRVFMNMLLFFFFKQKTAYEMRISDWSSDVCSSDLLVENVVMKNMFMLGTKDAGLDKLGRLEWDKGCSVLRQRLFFADVGTWGPVNLVRQVLDLTELLRMWAAPEHREKIGRASCTDRVRQYV